MADLPRDIAKRLMDAGSQPARGGWLTTDGKLRKAHADPTLDMIVQGQTEEGNPWIDPPLYPAADIESIPQTDGKYHLGASQYGAGQNVTDRWDLLERTRPELAEQVARTVNMGLIGWDIADTAVTGPPLLAMGAMAGKKGVKKAVEKTAKTVGGFRSAAREMADRMPQEVMTGPQLKGWMEKQGLRKTEKEWTGLDELFTRERVTRDELAQHIDAKTPKIKEVVDFAGDDPTKSGYVIRGQGVEGYGDDITFRTEGEAEDFMERQADSAMEDIPDMIDDYEESDYDHYWQQERDQYYAESYGDEYSDGVRYPELTIPGGENYREARYTMDPVADVPNLDNYHPTTSPRGSEWELKEAHDGWGYFDGHGYSMMRGARTPQEAKHRAYLHEHGDDPRVFHTDHWPEDVNVIAHQRLDDRVDAVDDNVLFSHENQSDLQAEYQALRAEAKEKAEKAEKDGTLPKGMTQQEYAKELYEGGFGKNALTNDMFRNFMDVHHPEDLKMMEITGLEPTIGGSGDHLWFVGQAGELLKADDVKNVYGPADGQAAQRIEALWERLNNPSRKSLPPMPYESTGDAIDFMAKRQIDTALKEGKDAIGWGMGDDITESQNNYIKKNLDRVVVQKSSEHHTDFDVFGYKDGKEIVKKGATKRNLGNYIGKDNAKKVLKEGASEADNMPYTLGKGEYSEDLNATIGWGNTRGEDVELAGWHYPEAQGVWIHDTGALEERYRVELIAGGEEYFDTLDEAEAFLLDHVKDDVTLPQEMAGWKFEGDDLQIGGHGNKVYYDEMWVNQVNKRMKKYGMKVEKSAMDVSETRGVSDANLVTMRQDREGAEVFPDGWTIVTREEVDAGIPSDSDPIDWEEGTEFVVLDSRTDIVGEGATRQEAIASGHDAVLSEQPTGDWYATQPDGSLRSGPFETQEEAQKYIESRIKSSTTPYWKLKFTDKFKKEWAEKGQSLFSAAPIIGAGMAGSEEDGKATDITDLLMESH